MEKTLYLAENQTLQVRCDGPSLWVRQARSAGQRVPARLVRRAIILGNVTLDTASLTLLAQRGVPISLLNRRGEPIAMVLGIQDGPRQRRVRQGALQENADKRARIAAWLDAWERGRQLRLVRTADPEQARRWRRSGYRQTDYDAWLLAQARARGCHPRDRTFLTGAMHELVATEILAQGWNPHAGVRAGGSPFGLVKDCYGALQPDMNRLWLKSTGSASEPRRPRHTRALAACFESARPGLESLLRALLDQYARLLWEV